MYSRPRADGYLPLPGTLVQTSGWSVRPRLVGKLSLVVFCLLSLWLISFSSLGDYILMPYKTNALLDDYDDGTYLRNDEIANIVSRTNGFFAKDYSLYLGWNNMRYIIEASLHQANLLNRTLIIPSFVYARGCEFDPSVCAAIAPTVNRNDALHLETWRNLPLKEQYGWKLDIRDMLNITLLRERHNIILMAEYLKFHNISTTVESSNGTWLHDVYHNGSNPITNKRPSLYTIQEYWYDWVANQQVMRVDNISEEMKNRGHWNETLGDRTLDQFGGWPDDGNFPDTWLSVAQELEGDPNAPLDAERLATGVEAVYTFHGQCGMDMSKHVLSPMRGALPRKFFRGWVNDFGPRTEDVVVLKGETHNERKPATMMFTTPQARDEYAKIVLYDMHPISSVYKLAAKLNERMTKLNHGRGWLGAHMRRGDFLQVGWAQEGDGLAHYRRIKEHLSEGRKVLKTISTSKPETCPIPDAIPASVLSEDLIPRVNDHVYIATDERNATIRQAMSDDGVKFIQDLITYEDRLEFGPMILVTDVVALVEQVLLSYSAYFYGHCISSFAGGVFNLRASRGADCRTTWAD